ncbi:phosphonoacetaldehyde reductase [Streptomyces sp. NRRL S-920]|uniref:phosphonoacetaldehyde reductase n=1 Tax=Streptomyces sp. NRRL S-920 TaxID=1463921 RepID=UPI00068D0AB3|nr:phosphonoacetaldehyde reductase [Streptomyces sp. NRRL S-920]
MTVAHGGRATSVTAYRGAAAGLPALCAGHRPLVVASDGALRRADVHAWLPAEAEVFTEFHPNPTVEQALEAARLRHAWGADLVVGIGGGSALDVAKAACLLPRDADAAGRVVAGTLEPAERVTLLLVPTTAGTGSEVTQFATLYQEGRKVSLDTPHARADLAVVDPALTDSCPAELTWSCAFDTLAHAVESLWSIRSTRRSREHAVAALERLVPVLSQAGAAPDPAERDALSRAATDAGRAIDITRTTAAHALSYPLTSRLGVPHGLACALNLTWLAPLVEAAGADEILDPRGPGAVEAALDALRAACGVTAGGLGPFVADLVTRRMPATAWRRPDADTALVDRLVAEGMSSNRMAGMPITLERARVRAGLVSALGAAPARTEDACYA